MSFINVEVPTFREQMIKTANIYCMLSMHSALFTVVRAQITILWGSSIWEQLAGSFWLRVFHEVAEKLTARVAVISKLTWGCRIHIQDHSCVFWQVSVPHHAGLSAGLCDLAAGCPWSEWSKTERSPKMEATVFHNSISEVQRLPLCHILWPYSPTLLGCRTAFYQRMDTGHRGHSE